MRAFLKALAGLFEIAICLFLSCSFLIGSLEMVRVRSAPRPIQQAQRPMHKTRGEQRE